MSSHFSFWAILRCHTSCLEPGHPVGRVMCHAGVVELLQRFLQVLHETPCFRLRSLVAPAVHPPSVETDEYSGLLQLFAARALVLASPSDNGDVAMDRVIRIDPAQWRQSLPEVLASEGVSETSWRTALQRRMEGLMLLNSGSYTQRVCAEFLDELRTVSDATASP